MGEVAEDAEEGWEGGTRRGGGGISFIKILSVKILSV